jgi:16S rRNA (uracil1498-N3)-methyltransferase
MHRGARAMTRRFYVGEGALDGVSVAIEGPLAHRLATVLRLRSGENVILFDGTGEDVLVRLDELTSKRVATTILERLPGPPEARTRVHLYQCITKGERFDWLVEKVTELGVARVVPLVTARSTVRTGEGNRLDRWRRIAVEAAEQCGRSVVLAVDAPMQFADALADAEGVLMLPYEEAGETAPSLQEALNERIDDLFAFGAISIFIGPEGGYESAEVEAAREAGATLITLGSRVFRSETAGLVASTLALQACGELG